MDGGFDWDRYWDDPFDCDEMVAGARNMAHRLQVFMEGHPASSVADFGCGPALTLFQLAAEMPSVRFTGLDPSSDVIARNGERARELGLGNLGFRVDTLPELTTGERFDLVTCIATLHYVADVRAAVVALFRRVLPGGSLVFNYPNRFTKAAYARWAAEGGPERARRFDLVIRGENLLSSRRIGELLGRRPRSFWVAVGEEGARENPCVVVSR